MGSIIPKPDYMGTIKALDNMFIVFGCSYWGPKNEAPVPRNSDFEFDSDSEPEIPEVQGHSQIAITTLPTLFLLILASTTICEGELIVKPSRDDFVFAVVYTDDRIEIDALLPVWQGARKGWKFKRCTVHAFPLCHTLRPPHDPNDWTKASWRQCVRITTALKIVKDHNERLAARLRATQFDGIVTDALKVWQDKGGRSKEGENYIQRLRDAGGDELEAYLNMQSRLTDP